MNSLVCIFRLVMEPLFSSNFIPPKKFPLCSFFSLTSPDKGNTGGNLEQHFPSCSLPAVQLSGWWEPRHWAETNSMLQSNKALDFGKKMCKHLLHLLLKLLSEQYSKSKVLRKLPKTNKLHSQTTLRQPSRHWPTL